MEPANYECILFSLGSVAIWAILPHIFFVLKEGGDQKKEAEVRSKHFAAYWISWFKN